MDNRIFAQRLFDAAVQAADPYQSVIEALTIDPIPQTIGKQIVVAFGKAAPKMIEAALSRVHADIALCVTNYENARDIKGVNVIAAGHPVPDENGLRAGQTIREILKSATSQDHVLCLISGGGSALVPCPRHGLTLDDKIHVNQRLLDGGLDITQMNMVRQQLSDLKGGGVLRHAAPAPVRALIVSDVIGDDPRAIASGPTAEPLGTSIDAQNLLKNHNIWNDLSPQIQTILQETDPAQTFPEGKNDVICTNLRSLQAMAKVLNTAQIVTDRLSGDVADAAELIAETIRKTPDQPLLWGGETTVTIKGNGKGGRNQELSLRVANLLQDLTGNWVFLSAGTDGRDGPTDAAGGLVDRTTITRLTAAGGSFQELLDNNDSNRALALTGDLFTTGATGTNVADIQVYLPPTAD